MTCRQFIDFLSEYLSGELTEAERATFDRHVAICTSCVAYLQNYRTTVVLGKAAFGAVEDLVPPEVPEELLSAILAARKAC